MDILELWHPDAAWMVGGATLLAALLRAGFANFMATLRALGGLFRHQKTMQHLRAELAGHVERLRRDGPLLAHLPGLHDAQLEDVTDAMIRQRSVRALLTRHEDQRALREQQHDAAVETLLQGAELGPAIGLVGTLVALASLGQNAVGADALAGAIGMAVATTLYGLVLAHFLLAPLAHMVSRRGFAEEQARQEVVDWLAEQLAPGTHDGAVQDRAHHGARHHPDWQRPAIEAAS